MSSLEKMICTTSILLTIAALGGCAGMVARSGAPCPTTYNGFKEGEATSADVKACLGDPINEDHNKDGRYVYVYSPSDNRMFTYLFDPHGKLVAFRAYGKK